MQDSTKTWSGSSVYDGYIFPQIQLQSRCLFLPHLTQDLSQCCPKVPFSMCLGVQRSALRANVKNWSKMHMYKSIGWAAQDEVKAGPAPDHGFQLPSSKGFL